MDLTSRRPGPDVVRAVAMTGVVVMNYHGYLILGGASRSGHAGYDLFDPWTGPLSTRFAATFVLTAGVGVTLMTRRTTGDSDATTAMRWRLVRRGLLLYGIGLVGLFVFGASFVLWIILKGLVGIRVSEENEYIGLDAAEIGIEAYPEFGKGSQSL